MTVIIIAMVSLGGASGKESAFNAGDVRDMGLIPGWQWSSGEGHGNPLWYSCPGNAVDRRSWWAAVHRIISIIVLFYYYKCSLKLSDVKYNRLAHYDTCWYIMTHSPLRNIAKVSRTNALNIIQVI